MLHHIQKSVIDTLASKDPARYADLKPATMDGNQFTYHLRQLLIEDLVRKNDNATYSLTEKGRAYLIRRFEDSVESAHSIFLVVIRYEEKILIRERMVQPLNGYVGFIHGEPKAGEPLIKTICDRVKVKTGISLNPDNLKTHGSGLIRITKNSQVQSFSHAIITEVTSDSTELPIIEDRTGRNFWVKGSELNNYKSLPSNDAILEYIQDSSANWFDWTYEI